MIKTTKLRKIRSFCENNTKNDNIENTMSLEEIEYIQNLDRIAGNYDVDILTEVILNGNIREV